jgi:F-type H+-transporting ATPase subunit delta
MKNPTLVKRYAVGLVGALRDETEFALVHGELLAFQALFKTNPELTKVLESPFVPSKKKNQIITNILAASPLSVKTVRFLGLLVEHGRLDILEEVLLEAPLLWKEKQGTQTFDVSSAFSLTPQQKERLQAELERREGKPVFLDYRIDPDLLGGLSLRKGNVIYDVSIQGRLAKLKEKMAEGS